MFIIIIKSYQKANILSIDICNETINVVYNKHLPKIFHVRSGVVFNYWKEKRFKLKDKLEFHTKLNANKSSKLTQSKSSIIKSRKTFIKK